MQNINNMHTQERLSCKSWYLVRSGHSFLTLLGTDPRGLLVGESKPGHVTLSFSEAAQVLESGQSSGPEGPSHPAIFCSAPSLWNWRNGRQAVLPQELWLSGLSLLITGSSQFLPLSGECWTYKTHKTSHLHRALSTACTSPRRLSDGKGGNTRKNLYRYSIQIPHKLFQ